MTSHPVLSIDPAFSSLCWELTGEELKLLAMSLCEEGCRDPILYWAKPGTPIEQCPIVDGCTRYRLCNGWLDIERAMTILEMSRHDAERICERLQHVTYRIDGLQFPSQESAIQWASRNQMGRRNASDRQMSQLRGMLYLSKMKKSAELPTDTVSVVDDNPFASANSAQQIASDQSKSPKRTKAPHLARETATETGTSERQIYRDAKYAKAIKALPPALADAALTRAIAKRDAITISSAPKEVIDGILKTPPESWRGAVKAAAKIIRKHLEVMPTPNRPGRPVVHHKALAELEMAAGKLIRTSTEAMKQCGGDAAAWAKNRHEAIRELMCRVCDEILGWQRDAEDVNEKGGKP